MSDSSSSGFADEAVTVRFWASAKAAAGREVEMVGAGSLDDVLAAVRRANPDNQRLADVIAMCSVLIGDVPVTTSDPAEVDVPPGATVELLPPFAGG
ncbi:MAG TPA: MoaD/ThiS family protein [Nocardioidaceae bacterium]|nr:MoaD/ThiS family protein [Nocardioidaceae bacterium]